MQTNPEDHFNRRRFVKANLQAISRLGSTQSFAQTAWGKPAPKKQNPGDETPGGGIIRL
jgi:hypothetical protein